MHILLYHGVRPNSDTTSPDIRHKHVPEILFRKQMQQLSKGYTPIKLTDVIQHLHEQKPFPKRAICLTFDDGYANNAETAAPILREFGVPATFFVTTGFIDRTTQLWVDRFEIVFARLPDTINELAVGEESIRFSLKTPDERFKADIAIRQRLKRVSPEERDRIISRLEERYGTASEIPRLLRPMTWEQIRGLQKDGFEIGAHTVNHPILSQCAAAAMRHEILDSKQRIEQELKTPCTHFAYPNGQPGDWNDDVKRVIQDANFASCLTTIEQPIALGDNPLNLGRTTVRGDESLTKFILTISGLRSTIQALRTSLHL